MVENFDKAWAFTQTWERQDKCPLAPLPTCYRK